ncbi:MAG: transglycosylase SLT domain-containing protein [Rhodospirillaceae bacterium]
MSVVAAQYRTGRLIGGVFAVVIGLGLGFAAAVPAWAGENDCHTNTSMVERQLHIPNGLLLAISLVESGVGGVPQPNALSFGLRSVVASSRDDAVRRMRGRIDNTFVGCMQLSLRHHKAAFSSLDKMMDPRANIYYAGNMLVRLRAQTGSWSRAVARYQGGSSEQSRHYVCRVWNHLAELDWNSAKKLEPRRCGEMASPVIAPKTRRAFQQSQVAQAPD